MKNNQLPKSWCVKHDGTEKFKKIVVGYLNSKYNAEFNGNTCRKGTYYGISNEEEPSWRYLSNAFNVELTLEEFIILSIPYSPTVGEYVYVSDDMKTWNKRIFISVNPLTQEYITVQSIYEEEYYETSLEFSVSQWRYIKKIPLQVECTPDNTYVEVDNDFVATLLLDERFTLETLNEVGFSHQDKDLHLIKKSFLEGHDLI